MFFVINMESVNGPSVINSNGVTFLYYSFVKVQSRIYTVNITMGCFRSMQFFHNITKFVLSQSLVQSLLKSHENTLNPKNVGFPSGIF